MSEYCSFGQPDDYDIADTIPKAIKSNLRPDLKEVEDWHRAADPDFYSKHGTPEDQEIYRPTFEW